MELIMVIVGLALAIYGAVLMVMSGGSIVGGGDAAVLARAKWRSRRGVVAIALGVVVFLLSVVGFPLRYRGTAIIGGGGVGGIILLVLLELLALGLDGVGIGLILMSRVVWRTPHHVDDASFIRWFPAAQHHTRWGVILLLVGFLAQIAGIAIIAF
ncbi:MAG TPA: hypothetical protein VKT70_11885 [Stellaceae bacterium]|nr:hypothetical protein [Stellaceae bacterium]